MKNILIILFFVLPTIGFTQEKKLSPKQQKKAERREKINQLIKQEEEGALIFNKQNSFSIKLNTDGYGILFEKGKYKTITKTNIWWLEISERKHIKETKSAKGDNTGFLIGNPFVYGKINNFYNGKIGFGQQRLIGGKGNKNGVATSLVYGGGLTMAYLKPYMLDVADPRTSAPRRLKYKDDPALFLNPTQILGASGFTRGFGFTEFVPGFQFRTALKFDYGRYTETISAIEVGINAEYYTKEIVQMAENPNKKFFFNAYLALSFGRRK